MKKYVKSYLAFTPFIYRIAMLIAAPIVIIGAGFWLGNVLMGKDASVISAVPGMAASFAALFIAPIEILADNWSFGGIQSKNTVNAAYLNTSYKGRDVLRRALCLDLIRKLIYEICIAAITYLMLMPICVRYGASPSIGANIFALIIVILTAHLFSVLGVWLARYEDMFWFNMLIAYIIQIPMMLSLFLIYTIQKNFYEDYIISGIIYILVVAVLDVSVCILSVRAAMKRYKRNYYDAAT